jgi:hypothetical protein
MSTYRSGIRIIDSHSNAKKKLQASLRSGIEMMTFSSCGRYLICAAVDSREILVFDIQDGASLDPRNIIAVDDFPVHLSCQSSLSKGYLDILCGYAGHGGCLIRIVMTSSDSTDASSPNEVEDIITMSRILIKENILTANFGAYTVTTSTAVESASNTSGGSKKHASRMISLAVGQLSHPAFYQLEIESAEDVLLKEISLHPHVHGHIHHKTAPATATTPTDTSTSSSSIATTVESTNGAIIELKSSSTKGNSDRVILGPLDTGGSKRPAYDGLEQGDTKRLKSSASAQGEEDMSMDIDISSAEQTLEQRLMALSTDLKSIERSSSTAAAVKPTTDSLVTLIEQALQSGDNAMLEQCLSSNDVTVIDETCRRLPASRVMSFLKKLVAKFEKSPSRGILLTRWLSSLLKFHTSYLISIPDLAKQLGGLSQLLEARLSSYNRLVALNGRLDMLMSQLSSVSASAAIPADNQLSQSSHKPKRIYIEE